MTVAPCAGCGLSDTLNYNGNRAGVKKYYSKRKTQYYHLSMVLLGFQGGTSGKPAMQET